MEVSRRDCLRAGIVAGVGSALMGCAPLANRLANHPDARPLPKGDTRPAKRLLDRVAFGPRPGDIARVEEMGHEAYVRQQLAASQTEDVRLRMLLSRLDVYRLSTSEQFDLPKGVVMAQLQQAGILRSVYGQNQLLERMVDFWTNHFNIYAPKADGTFRLGTEELQVLRANALGKFPDLLSASAHSPAMLTFLDNPQNHSGSPNENYGRELMELHTMGVGSGYTQKDVQEVARCFTGWTVETRFLRPKGKFRFDEDLHDNGAKTVLGNTIPAGGGQQDGEKILEILCNRPETARFISKKLVTYFLGKEDKNWTDALASIFLHTGGDIRQMLEPLLLSKELLESTPRLKRPFDYMVSAMRAVDCDTDAGHQLQDHLTNMGQALHMWPMPDGYPVRMASWTGSMLPRWNFAYALANDEIGGTSVKATGDWFELTHGRKPGTEDAELTKQIEASTKKEALALCLASPGFQWA